MGSEGYDDQFLAVQWAVANKIVTKLNAVRKVGCVAVAIEMISRRIIGSGDSLAILHKHSPHDWMFDGISILRNIYDVTLQGLYIMSEPAKRDERAQLYLDFMDVERMKRIGLFDASDTDIAKHFSSSPKRPEAEPAIKQRFDAVKDRFMTKKGELRDYWYRGSLRDLAKASGLEGEYELIQRLLSGVVHSSPLTLRDGPFLTRFFLLDCQWRFAFRILGVYAEYKGIELDETETALIGDARANVFNLP